VLFGTNIYVHMIWIPKEAKSMVETWDYA
jgi:predicted FMN-binding regulatory protein PaiB